jgi:hypothetical protein
MMEESSTRKSFPAQVLLLALIACTVMAGGLVLSGTQALAAGSEPVIISISASNVSEHGATLEAQIDSNGLETTYEFWVESANCQPGPCNSISVGSVGHGYISAGLASQTVSVVLSDLQPYYSYTYWVFAANSAGWVKGSGKEFEAVDTGGGSTGGSPLPPVENTATPFERPVESWIGKATAEGAARELTRAKQEREAKERQVKEEQEVKERPLKEALLREEAEAREAEREARAASGGVLLDNAGLTVQRTGVVVVKLDCTGIGACSGKLTLKAKKGKKTATIGTASFSIPVGKAEATKLTLNVTGRALLSADHGRLNAVSLTIAELQPAPGQTQTKHVRLVERNGSQTALQETGGSICRTAPGGVQRPDGLLCWA